MKRQWDIEELIEHFTLVKKDLDLLANKSGPTRLGFALLLKCFQLEGRFPHAKHEIPKDVVNYVAHQLKLDSAIYSQYDWEGRTVKSHRAQIREELSFREATALDTEEMKSWLIAEHLASDQKVEHLQAKVLERFSECKIEPPTNERIERLIRSACNTYEQQFFEQVSEQFPQETRKLLDSLLQREDTSASRDAEDQEGSVQSKTRQDPVTWNDLKTNPGAERTFPERNSIIAVKYSTAIKKQQGKVKIHASVHWVSTRPPLDHLSDDVPEGAGDWLEPAGVKGTIKGFTQDKVYEDTLLIKASAVLRA